MAEYKAVEQLMQKVGETIEQAEQVYEDSQRVQAGDHDDYINAQSQLEGVNSELESLLRVANPEQRDQLNRAKQQIRQLQNHMIMR